MIMICVEMNGNQGQSTIVANKKLPWYTQKDVTEISFPHCSCHMIPGKCGPYSLALAILVLLVWFSFIYLMKQGLDI